jgi:hypothetical protein
LGEGEAYCTKEMNKNNIFKNGAKPLLFIPRVEF